MGLHIMRPLLTLLSRFRTDERGAFGVIFAVLAIVLIAMSGAAVDFTVIQQARTRAQVALDAAALALQPTIYTATTSTIRTNAQALLVNRLADAATSWGDCNTAGVKAPCASVAMPTVDTVNGVLTLQATLKVPMYFVSMVGVPQISAQIVSVATRKKLALEVALVLDNSGSMGTSFGSGTRLSVLKASANCASNILFYGGGSVSPTDCTQLVGTPTLNSNVKMGLVPFNDEVNVGATNASASWLDRAGNSTTTYVGDNFDDDDNDTTAFSGTVDRIGLFNSIQDRYGTALSWRGCVEARKYPYDTDDTAPDSSNKDTLFAPFFAPDNPSSGSYSNNYISDSPAACNQTVGCTWKEVKTRCTNWSSCSGTDTNTYSFSTGYHHPPSSCNCNSATILTDTGTNTYTGTNKNKIYTRVRTCNYTYSPTTQSSVAFTARELQERLCKYDGAKMTSSISSGFGPNSDCPASSIQPLTNTPATLKTAVNSMVADGNTNIQEGTAWGFRVLSPTEPFTEGGAYDTATSKVLIIMTDGENTFSTNNDMNGARLYSPYGYPWDNYKGGTTDRGRMGTMSWSDGDFETEINSRLSTTCTNAKNAGITIYTIGLATNATSNPSGNKALLTNCASEASDAYFPTSATDLQAAFVAIANQLSALRLSK